MHEDTPASMSALCPHTNPTAWAVLQHKTCASTVLSSAGGQSLKKVQLPRKQARSFWYQGPRVLAPSVWSRRETKPPIEGVPLALIPLPLWFRNLQEALGKSWDCDVLQTVCPSFRNHYQVFQEKLKIQISVKSANFTTLTINSNNYEPGINGSAGQELTVLVKTSHMDGFSQQRPSPSQPMMISGITGRDKTEDSPKNWLSDLCRY